MPLSMSLIKSLAKKFLDMGIGNDFWEITPKAQAIKI